MSVISHMRGEILELALPEQYTKAEFLAGYTEAIRTFGLKSPTPVLIDARRIRVERSAHQILDAAEWHSQLMEHVGPKFAVLVSEDLNYGFARMFGAFADAKVCIVEIFRDEKKAMTWLTD